MKKYTTSEVIDKLAEAYSYSTQSHNRFEEAVKAIDWDEFFQCEDGYQGSYESHGSRILFAAEALDPFSCHYCPDITFMDNGSTMTLEQLF